MTETKLSSVQSEFIQDPTREKRRHRNSTPSFKVKLVHNKMLLSSWGSSLSIFHKIPLRNEVAIVLRVGYLDS